MAAQIAADQKLQSEPEISLEKQENASELDDQSSEDTEPVVTLKTWIVSGVNVEILSTFGLY